MISPCSQCPFIRSLLGQTDIIQSGSCLNLPMLAGIRIHVFGSFYWFIIDIYITLPMNWSSPRGKHVVYSNKNIDSLQKPVIHTVPISTITFLWFPDPLIYKKMGEFRVHHVRFMEYIPKAVHCMAYNDATQRLAVSRSDGSIEIWSIQDNWFQEKVRVDSAWTSM